MYILDTNICRYFMRNQYPGLTEKLLSLSPSDLALSPITVFELVYGARRRNWGGNMMRKLAMFIAPFTILDFDMNDAIAAGKVRASLEKQGVIIGPYDILIASQGLARDYTVVTHNIGEFSRVSGLKVEDWVV